MFKSSSRIILVTCVFLVSSGSSLWAEDIALRCTGIASVDDAEVGRVEMRDSSGSISHGTVTNSVRRDFPGEVLVRVVADSAEIKIPEAMIPTINSKNHDGWWSVYNLTMDQKIIEGSFKINFLRKPKFTINRVAGSILLSSSGDFGFNGSCEKYDPAGTGVKF
jgi:hypothetical protein